MRIDLLVQKAIIHKFLRILQSSFPMLQSTVQMESSRSSTQTITTTSSNVVKTLVKIPFIEALKIRTDLLAQKAVIHNFLQILQSPFPMLQSQVQIQSRRSSTQTVTTTSSNIVETFVWIPIVEASKMRIYFLVQKDVIHSFLRILQSPFPMLQSTVQIGSSRSSTQTITTTSSNVVETFVKILFIEKLKIRTDLLAQKAVIHSFLRILHSPFPMESCRSST